MSNLRVYCRQGCSRGCTNKNAPSYQKAVEEIKISPDQQESAVQLVLEQAKQMCEREA